MLVLLITEFVFNNRHLELDNYILFFSLVEHTEKQIPNKWYAQSSELTEHTLSYLTSLSEYSHNFHISTCMIRR